MDGEVIVAYGDIVYSGEILDRLLSSSADIAVAVDKEWESYWRSRSPNPLSDVESLRLGREGAILEIGQPPKSLAEVEGQYIGLMKFTPRGIEQIKRVFQGAVKSGNLGRSTVEASHMTDLLQALILEGIPVTAIESREPWIEIDTVSDLFLKSSLQRVRHITLT